MEIKGILVYGLDKWGAAGFIEKEDTEGRGCSWAVEEDISFNSSHVLLEVWLGHPVQVAAEPTHLESIREHGAEDKSSVCDGWSLRERARVTF